MQSEVEPESDADMHSGSDSTLTELESTSSVRSESERSESERSESDSDDHMQSASASASETEVHPILAFYDSEHNAPFDPEDPETTFEQVMLWTDSELEHRHDYIQHLFPIPEVSGANPNAPVLTEEVRDAFIADPDLQENMRRAWVMMMAFFGWELATEEMAEGAHVRVGYPVPRRHFRDLAEQTWLQHSNHNQLRITRIIRSMRILGLYEEAQMMTSALMDADEAAQNVVNAETLGIWFDTSIRPVCYPPMFPKNDVPVCDWLLGLDPDEDGTEEVMPADDYEDESISRQGFLEGASLDYEAEGGGHPGIYEPHFPEHPLSAVLTPDVQSLYQHYERFSPRLRSERDSESPERLSL
ncbi:hypothetical protein LTR35_008731 [Friedmanniomyces endolithicus]|uniref:Opioid growth factor receptor (OGFr) conserved domain-containing protein n=1 Tax=Friedmanniomyces endolithicus TaxID=329885 RepID=A0AAN6FNJ0_9PEZI|nr:hypothetical protein LTS00_013569 [Friedmanniomyces endolithicus]KAK0279541.1 hypothetical protein LTR35_008731 [Friedmanniomyces endolithicus]KAK0320920.1 hypothetical protein LTR82_008239 [Friedmanniomyces endolithicus]KAK1004374.1 hypothetical protein LTR54_007372 [Friedmanniomyces endolithicus]